MMLSFGTDRPRRRPNLTPMIDVVFLLLVFFMLAARFGDDRTLPLTVAGDATGYSGPPRLVDVAPGSVHLNGQPVAAADLVAALGRLTESPDDAIVLRADGSATLQDLIGVVDRLTAAGFTRLVLVE